MVPKPSATCSRWSSLLRLLPRGGLAKSLIQINEEPSEFLLCVLHNSNAELGRKKIAMSNARRILISFVPSLLIALPSGGAVAATVVQADLWDKGAKMEMPIGITYAAPGLDLSKSTMGIKLDRSSAPAGVVTFKVTNVSKDTIHELIVMYMNDPRKPLPYIDKENRVDEDKAGDKGEVSELDPGQSGTLSVPLRVGKYLLICNVPGHYAAGMWTEFEVTK